MKSAIQQLRKLKRTGGTIEDAIYILEKARDELDKSFCKCRDCMKSRDEIIGKKEG